jgi:hypothetical protein
MCKHCWDEDGPHHKDFIRGGVTPEDFEETNYQTRLKSNKKRPKKQRGCPENDFGPHVYVWIPMPHAYDWWDYDDDFYRHHGFHRREAKVCCGCGKKVKSRYTEEFQKLVNKKGWYNASYGYRH